MGVFNMIPVPPLDGSRVFLTFLPPKYYFGIMKYERYIMIGLLLIAPTILGSVIYFIGDLIVEAMLLPFIWIMRLFSGS
jgi:Zn-dependent protease